MNIKDKEKTKIISSQKIKEKNYWLENLSGELEKTSFPYDYRNLKAKEFSRDITAFVFPQKLFPILMQVSRNSDIRLYIILSAAVVILLKKYTGSSDIIHVSPIYKQRLKGEFINTVLVLRNYLHEDMSFKELLLQVGQTVKNANENQNYPLEVLMEQLNVLVLKNEYSLFDTAVLLENIHDREYLKHIRLNMIFSFSRTGTSIEGTIGYNSQLYKKTTIEGIINHLKNLLYNVLHRPDSTESDISILSDEEKKQLLFDFNDTRAQYPRDKVISTLFAEQVKKAPHHTAVTYKDARLTYNELNKQANHLAGALRVKGISRESMVGLLLGRSLAMIGSILGILKAGGAYMPIDPDYPPDRINYMLADSDSKILVTTQDYSNKIKFEKEIIHIPGAINYVPTPPHLHLSPAPVASLAYIIYTSGTTGKPKGVLIEHRNVVRLLFNQRFQFNFNHQDTWTMFHSYCFDFSVWEMYGALLYGGQLVVIPRRITMDPARYLEILKQGRVTVLNQTPTAFYNLAAEELKQPGKALCLKYVIFGGEALNPLQLKDWKEKYPGTKLINMFGITETTVHVTYKEISPQDIRFNKSNIGTPIPTLCTYVMDKNLALRPIGAPGELFVGGEGVSRGYLNQPELTKEKFVKNLHKSGERLYKSGDLVKLSDTGEMEYMGRIDHQVQVRGFRVELGEIQAHLLKHEEIKEALVLAREGENGEKSLCAYIVSQKALEVSALREYLSRELPAYMIPANFVRVEQIPLTSNGKVDRKALPHPQTPPPGTVYTAPRNEIEETLASIWANLLDLERVGVHEDYFNIGGDSIKAIRLLNSINDTLHTNLKIVDLFAHETIEKLAQRIIRGEIDDGPGMANQRKQILREIEELKTRIMAKHQSNVYIEDIYPMSDIEKGMVYYTLKDPIDAAYHDQMLYHVRYKDFNPQAFKRALHVMAEKHPILRTSFHIEDYEEPVQMVRKSIPIDLEHMDISHMNREEQTGCVKQWLIKDREKGFDVTRAPLWRVTSFQLTGEYLCVALVTHHAVLDGWSVAALLTELNNTYLKIKVEPDFVPGKLASTYKDFIVEQLLEKKKQHAHEYWQKELQDYKRLDFMKRKQGDTFTAARVFSLNLGKNLLEELKTCAIQWNTTLKNLCLAAYIYMLNMASFENDIVVGMVTSGRPVCEDGDKILGCFLNTVPFRLKIPGSTTWVRFMEIVDREQLEAAAYNRISLFEILRIIGENPRDTNPIFDTIFNFVDFHVFEQVKYEQYGKSQADSTLPLPVDGYVKTNTLLDFNVDLSLGGFIISVNYTNSSFNQEEIQTLCDYFLQILKTFVSEPQSLMSKDKIISPGDREKLLYTFNRTEADYPRASLIHELFERQVERIPDHTALVGKEEGGKGRGEPFGEMHLSYRELNKKSHQLAHCLREQGVKPDTVVGIMVERSLEMMIGIFGILKAGGAYLPIDPDYPRERINYMLNDSSSKILITTQVLSREIEFANDIIYLGDAINRAPTPHLLSTHPSTLPSPHPNLPPWVNVPTTSLAYIIYTSGSTGKPKGVMVKHRSTVNTLVALQNKYPFEEWDVYLLKTSVVFDVSIAELFGCFINERGGKLVILEKGGEKDPQRIMNTVESAKVTHINFVPSMFNVFVQAINPQNIKKLSSLRYIFLAGEALLPPVVNQFRNSNQEIALENIYGPTEATIYASWYSLSLWSKDDVIPIGKPLPNVKLFILDRNLNLQPIGVAGELSIAGAGVARGYLNRPQLTAEKFCLRRPGGEVHSSWRFAHSVNRVSALRPALCALRTPPRKNFLLFPVLQYPIPPSPHSPMYMTGDLARWQPDGNIEFLGRIDDQVKIRGNRIEPGEIESRLKNHPGIKDAAVVVKIKEAESNHNHAEFYLCAYLVTHTGISIPATRLRVYLQRYLPDYMVPSFYVRLEKLPMTPSGKLNRKALPHPEIASDQPYSAPRHDVEKKLVKIWAQVLNIKQENPGHDMIGIDDNFFQLGGHSLTAVILVSKIHKVFDAKISLEELFKVPTIRAIASCIKTAQPDKFSVIQPVEQKEYYLLSFSQRRLYFLHHLDETGTAYNIPFVIRLHGDIDGDKLEKTVNRMMLRHESLRTSFLFIGDEPLQKIHHRMPLKIKYYNFAAENTTGRERGARIIENFVKPFDLSQPLLLRIGLIKVREKEHLLVMDMHHIISDGVSFTVLVTDFMHLYQDKELPRLSIQYKDFSYWQRMESEKEAFKQQETFWVKEFSIHEEVPMLNLPTDYARPVIRSFAGSTLGFEIDGETSEALKKCALQQGTTLYIVLLALYFVFLAKITNQEDIVVGTPVAGRRHADLEHIIGIFVNTLALRNYPNNSKIFREFLSEVKEKTLVSLENQDYPFEDLIEKVYNRRDTSRNPLFDTLCVMQNIEMSKEEGISHLKIFPYKYENKTAKFDLSLHAAWRNTGLSLEFEYCTRLFNRSTVERFTRYFRNICFNASQNIEAPLFHLEILSKEERHQLMVDFNDTTASYPEHKTLWQLIAEQVERTPDHPAVVGPHQLHEFHQEETKGLAPLFDPMYITYRELNARSNRLVHLLIEKGVQPDTIVGIMVERSLEMIIGIFAILKANGAYLPIDPGYPLERINYMLKDSGVRMLLTTSSLTGDRKIGRWEGENILITTVDTERECFTKENHLHLSPWVNPTVTSLAYIIYTSGSTGKPKGVMIKHGSVVNRINWMQEAYPLHTSDVILQKTTYTFDVSVWEIFWWAVVGAKVCLLIPGGEKDPGVIVNTIAKYNITVIHFVPSMLSVFLSYLQENLNKGVNVKKISCLKQVFSSGEALTVSQVERFNEIIYKKNSTKMANLYGPTEAAIDVSYFDCFPYASEKQENIPIGKPIDNINLYIVNKSFGLQPIGVPGELSISGVGLARGYLNRPELTAETFINPSPFTHHPSPIYKTGDLARWLYDGNIEFLDRIDHQVKIRGFRIEPGEIENQLLKHESIKEAVVIVKEDASGDKNLAAYYVSNRDVPGEELRENLLRNLPDYMIPGYFVRINHMPVTPNGKVDRRALPEPDIKPGEHYIAPRSETEKKLLELWIQLLGLNKEIIGVDSNFFQLGGHSLKAILLASRIHKHFHKKIPLTEIFRKPTIRAMASYINEQKEYTYSDIPPIEKRDYYVLSSAQKRLFILYQINPGDLAYNITSMMTMEGEADKYKFEGIFQKIINRHESLRTSFHVINEKPVQRILDELEFNIEYYDLTSFIRDTDPGSRKQAIINNFIHPFDFSQAPLLRVELIKTGENTHLFMADIHHIISDGISMTILIREFLTLYNGDILPAMKIQYKDYSQWQNQLLESGEMSKQENYWLKQFEGEIPVLSMLTDYKRPEKTRFEGESIYFTVSKELIDQLKEITRNAQTTLYTIFLAVYSILLSKYTGQDDIVVGSGIAGRNHTDLENIIGMFINMIAMKNQPAEDKTFGEFLEEVKECTLKAFENQDYPFDELVKKLGLQGNLNRNPLFDTQFTFQNIPQETGKISGLTFKPYQSPKQPIQFDLSLNGTESGETIIMALTYWQQVFKRETIEKMTNHFIEILEQSLENIDIKIGDITLSHELMAGKSDFSKNDAMSFGF